MKRDLNTRCFHHLAIRAPFSSSDCGNRYSNLAELAELTADNAMPLLTHNEIAAKTAQHRSLEDVPVQTTNTLWKQ
jgi:hypothetical protein